MTLHRWWPFVLLLIAAASRWVVADAHPEAAPTLASAALGCGWAALVLFLFRSARMSAPPRSVPLGLLAGAMLLGGPAVGLIIGANELNAGALTMALALTPVAVAIGLSALGDAGAGDVAGRIWPGLAAVAGLLLVLIQPNLSNPRSDIALVLAPIVTGLGGALFVTRAAATPGEPSRFTGAVALLGGALLFVVATVATAIDSHGRPALSPLAIAYEGILALLSVLTLCRLGATRWSSQFTWLPLLILLEGIVMVRPPVTVRWFTWIALLGVASVYLLMPRDDEEPKLPAVLVRK